MWRRNRRIQQKNFRCHQKQRWCRCRNHRFERRNQPIRRIHRQLRSITRNLIQQRSWTRRIQIIRRIKLLRQIRKCRLSYCRLRTHHRKIINHRSQHQRWLFSFSRIEQIRSLQPHHVLSLSCLHLLLRIFRQSC